MSIDSKENMHFLEHLNELRKRLIFIIIAITITSCLSFLFSQEIFEFLTKPYHDAFTGNYLIGTGPAEAFLLKLKSAILFGLIIGSPFIFLQLWLFISPALHQNERIFAAPFIITASCLFIGGVYFCYIAVLPFAFEFFKAEYASIGLTPTIRISEYFSISVQAMVGFGVVFETPVLAFFLGKLGILSSQALMNAGRYAIVGIFLISAILTPPDVITQLLMAGPLLILYALSIVIVKFVEPKS
ncbi:MAG: twin-arginine translocase subunit TatC [Bdellovibrionales bacterium]|nr:twin-arginine translocase subunit TatC [Bdellovibrionales bacterium]